MTPYCRVLLCATMLVICLFPLSAERALPEQAQAPRTAGIAEAFERTSAITGHHDREAGAAEAFD